MVRGAESQAWSSATEPTCVYPGGCSQQTHTDGGLDSHTPSAQRDASGCRCPLCLQSLGDPVNFKAALQPCFFYFSSVCVANMQKITLSSHCIRQSLVHRNIFFFLKTITCLILRFVSPSKLDVSM